MAIDPEASRGLAEKERQLKELQAKQRPASIVISVVAMTLAVCILFVGVPPIVTIAFALGMLVYLAANWRRITEISRLAKEVKELKRP